MRNVVGASLFAFLIALAAPAAAQNAYVYAVHGIPGANGFPVDIAVNGNCTLTGFTFGPVRVHSPFRPARTVLEFSPQIRRIHAQALQH